MSRLNPTPLEQETTSKNPDRDESLTHADPDEDVWKYVCEDTNKRLTRVTHPVPAPTIPPVPPVIPFTPDVPVSTVTSIASFIPAPSNNPVPSAEPEASDVPAAPVISSTPVTPEAPDYPDIPKQGVRFILAGFRSLGNAPDLRR